MPTRSPYPFALAAAGLFLLIGLLTLGRYGITWDSPENLLTGYHTLQFYRTGDAGWLDFGRYDALYQEEDDRPPLYNRNFNAPHQYPPVANVAANLTHAAAVRLFGPSIGFAGYHLSVLLFAALTVFVLACFTWQAFGPAAALAATLALTTYPLFFEHAHNNLKDVPFAALVLLALWAYWQAARLGRARWAVLSAVATGLAMGVRVIALQVYPLILLAYLPACSQAIHRRSSRGAPETAMNRLTKSYQYLPWHLPLALLVFLAAWPWLWADPLGRLGEHLRFAADAGRGLRVLYDGQIWLVGQTLPWHYTPVLFALTTPPLVLLGGLFGAAVAARRVVAQAVSLPSSSQADSLRYDLPAALLLLGLFLLALVRSTWPTIPQYDGTRHLMDGLVAFAGLFGLGVAALWDAARRRWPGLHGRAGALAGLFLLALAFAPTVTALIRLHPYQGIYYNALAGGVSGAADRFPQEYWGSSFLAAAGWLSDHAEPDAVILPRVGGHLLRLHLPDDPRLIADEALPTLPPNQTLYVVYMARRDKYDGLTEWVDAHLTPAHVIEREGAVLLKVVRTEVGVLQGVP